MPRTRCVGGGKGEVVGEVLGDGEEGWGQSPSSATPPQPSASPPSDVGDSRLRPEATTALACCKIDIIIQSLVTLYLAVAKSTSDSSSLKSFQNIDTCFDDYIDYTCAHPRDHHHTVQEFAQNSEFDK